jgi:hypothetical protein
VIEEELSAVADRPRTSSASWAALMFSIIGLALCALMAFGLLAMPVLDPLGLWSIRVHDAADLALIVGAVGPIPAVVGIVLGVWARRDAGRRGWPTRTAASAMVVGLVAVGLTALGWIVNDFAAS